MINWMLVLLKVEVFLYTTRCFYCCITVVCRYHQRAVCYKRIIPMLIDTHCHLNVWIFPWSLDRALVVLGVLCIGLNMTDAIKF